MKRNFLHCVSKKTLFAMSFTALMALVGCSNKTDTPKDETNSTQNQNQEETYNIVRPSYTPDYTTYGISKSPSAVNLTYYSDIYSRGFSWITDDSVTDSKLYLVKSDKGQQADFSSATPVEGTTLGVTCEKDGNVKANDGSFTTYKGSSNDYELKINSHKVHVENLEKGKAYSYKVGSEEGWAYGAFIVEKEAPEGITAIQLSDAQTKDPGKLNVWRNTFTKAVEKAGNDLDTVLYNGDQFDQNMSKPSGESNKAHRFLRHTKAYDIIQDYKFNLPYMASSGNHEPSAPYCQYLTSDINYAGYDNSGAYYSYDYSFAHFTVLNTNEMTDAQINWLKSDLDKATSAKWKIVMLHIAPYSTGDHTNAAANQSLVEKLTPIFSSKHVDLVLQAHDHTYNKTLPYKWDAAGYTTTNKNSDVVNLEPATETIDNITYDKNPNGTYYVTTGAAGHRCGAPEGEDGIWAEVVKDGEEYKGVDSSKTFLSNKYKIEMGKLKYANQYGEYSVGSYSISQNYKVGDLATGCVNAQMFGILNLTNSTLSYNVYTVNNETVKLFDSLDILKK